MNNDLIPALVKEVGTYYSGLIKCNCRPHFWQCLPIEAKKIIARKSRIGSMHDMISSVTMCPWDEMRAPARKQPNSIETSSSSVSCQERKCSLNKNKINPLHSLTV